MKDQSKTKPVLIQELLSLRKRIAELEQATSDHEPEEAKLHLSEADYRSIFDDIPDAIFSADAGGTGSIQPAAVRRRPLFTWKSEARSTWSFWT